MIFNFTNWFLAALLGMVSFGGMALTFKKLTYLLPMPVMLVLVYGVTGLFYLAYTWKLGLSFTLDAKTFGYIILASVFAFFGNIGDVEAMRLAPNSGYAAAVKAGQIVLITFAALWLFPDQKLTFQGVLGVAFVFSGVALLATQR